jgi:hypothetical protein
MSSKSATVMVWIVKETFKLRDQEVADLEIDHGKRNARPVKDIVACDKRVKRLHRALLKKWSSTIAISAASVSDPTLAERQSMSTDSR